MGKKYAIKIPGMLIFSFCVLGSGQISMAQAEDLCGNALCEATESCITCEVDCSCGEDFEWNCADAIDNDLDKIVDCNDPDCTEDLECVIVSEIKAVPLKNLPLSESWGGKSAAHDEDIDFATATGQIAARVPFWIYLSALACTLLLLLMHMRLRLMHFEDQDEW